MDIKNKPHAKGKLHTLKFMRRSGESMNRLADSLISLKCVEEVFLNESTLAYIARVRFFYGEEPFEPKTYLHKHVALH